jgi:hypothetical protein
MIFTLVHAILHTFLIHSWRTDRVRTHGLGAGVSLLLSRESVPTETSRCRARFLTSERMSHDIAALYGDAGRENYDDYRRILGTRGARDVARLAISAIRGGRRARFLLGSARSSARYHLCRTETDRDAAGRLMISRCMANAANCRPGRNWARRDAGGTPRGTTTSSSPRRRVRANDVDEKEELSRRFRSEQRVL